jgi:membrane protease YdiL (CAAX protease family)
MNKTLQSVFIILVFLFAVYGKRILDKYLVISIDSSFIRILYSYAWWIIPICLAVGLLYGFKNVLKELCLDKNIYVRIAFSLVVVSPMLISSAVIGKIDTDLDVTTLMHKTLFAGFMEEILFRGFLFGILFRKIGWGFIPAAVLGAVIFALSHLYQGSTTNEMIGIFLITFLGSAWFAWLFVEWEENLWVPIFLHVFMNLSWTLFDVSDNALGGTYTNIFRIITITLTVGATIMYNNRNGGRYRVNSKNLFLNKAVVDNLDRIKTGLC